MYRTTWCKFTWVLHHCQEEARSLAKRFFGRALRMYLPNSVERYINHKELIEKHHQKQLGISEMKGTSCTKQYKVGDRVITQDHLSKRWNIHGTVTVKRVAEDGTFRSFTVQVPKTRVEKTLNTFEICYTWLSYQLKNEWNHISIQFFFNWVIRHF